jgi:hypothetical protein
MTFSKRSKAGCCKQIQLDVTYVICATLDKAEYYIGNRKSIKI